MLPVTLPRVQKRNYLFSLRAICHCRNSQESVRGNFSEPSSQNLSSFIHPQRGMSSSSSSRFMQRYVHALVLFMHRYVHEHVCSCAGTFMHRYVQALVGSRRDTSMHSYFHAQVGSCTCMFMHGYVHAQVRSCTSTFMQRYV